MLTVNETKRTTENASNRDHFWFAGSRKLECDERALFCTSLENPDMYFNP